MKFSLLFQSKFRTSFLWPSWLNCIKYSYDDCLLDADRVVHGVAVDLTHVRDAHVPVARRRREDQLAVRRPERLGGSVRVVLLREDPLVQVPHVVHVCASRGRRQDLRRVQSVHVEL